MTKNIKENSQSELFMPQAFRYKEFEDDEKYDVSHYLAAIPFKISIMPGHEYKDGTRQWIVYGRLVESTSKAYPTLFTCRGTKEDAEEKLAKYLKRVSESMLSIIHEHNGEWIKGE